MKSCSSVLRKQATDCEMWLGIFWQVGGWNTAQNICGSQALKTHCFRCLLGNIPKLSYPSKGWLLIIKQFGAQCLFFRPNSRVIWESWVPEGENKRPQGPTKTHTSRGQGQPLWHSSMQHQLQSWKVTLLQWAGNSLGPAKWAHSHQGVKPIWSIEYTVLHVWIQGNSLTISLKILMCRRQEN